MPRDHLLIRKAHRFASPGDTEVHAYWRYRREVAAWVEAEHPERLMVSYTSAKPGDTPKPVPTSKKADRETGEDMKGA